MLIYMCGVCVCMNIGITFYIFFHVFNESFLFLLTLLKYKWRFQGRKLLFCFLGKMSKDKCFHTITPLAEFTNSFSETSLLMLSYRVLGTPRFTIVCVKISRLRPRDSSRVSPRPQTPPPLLSHLSTFAAVALQAAAAGRKPRGSIHARITGVNAP